MNKRKFIYFTDEELNNLVNIFGSGGELDLLKSVKEEQRIRETNRKIVDEWKNRRPKYYAC